MAGRPTSHRPPGGDASEYDLADPRTLRPLIALVRHNTGRDFHPGLQLFATGSGPADDRPRLVTFASRTAGPPVVQPGRVALVRFSQAGDALLTGEADRVVRLWPAP